MELTEDADDDVSDYQFDEEPEPPDLLREALLDGSAEVNEYDKPGLFLFSCGFIYTGTGPPLRCCLAGKRIFSCRRPV